MNRLQNQSTYASIVIQPLGDTAYLVPNGPPLVQLAMRCFPVKTIYGGRRVPLAPTHTCTVIFSLPDPPIMDCGDFIPLLQMIWAGRPLNGKPLSSTLKMHCGLSPKPRLSKMGFRQWLNQWSTTSGVAAFALPSVVPVVFFC